MILYNTTFTFHKSLSAELAEWLRDNWIPEAEASGQTGSTVGRLMVEIDPSASAYAVQGRFTTEEAAARWRDGRGAELLASLHKRYGENILPFTTFMEVLEL